MLKITSKKVTALIAVVLMITTANTASTRPSARSKPATSTDRIGHAHGALYHCCFQTPRRNFSTAIAACRL